MPEVAWSINRLQAESKASAKHQNALLGALASLQAISLAADGFAVVHTLDPQQPSGTPQYAKMLASRLITETATALALVIAPDTERASVVLAAKFGLLDCGTLLRTSLAAHNGRGGGTCDMAQGALPSESLPTWQSSIMRTLEAAR